MSERKKQIFLEALKKAKKESVMGKLANGDTDPMEPWSKKHAPLDEVNTQVLWRYIKAMGRDPRTISLNDRLNLARTDRFKKFARDHVKLIQQQKEEVGQIDEMDKSAPQPGRDGKVSHSTYGSRDKEGSDYFKGKEIPAKQISVKQMEKDALAILKKQGVAEGLSEMDNRTPSGDHREQRANSPEAKAQREKEQQERLKKVSPEMRKKLGLPEPKEQGVAEGKKPDRYHIVGKDGKPANLASYADRASAIKDRDEKHPGAVVQQVGPRGKVKSVAEEAVNEAGTGTLMSYIKAKGLNPLSMDGNQKNKYSHSSEFKLFKHRKMKAETSGMGERGDDWNEEKKPVKEAVDEKDTVTMDIPLLIRVLEFIREDVKTDMDLHRVVENLIQVRNDGVLTMDHYDQIVHIKKMKEDVEQVDEITTTWIHKKAPYYSDRAEKEKTAAQSSGSKKTDQERSVEKKRTKGLERFRKKAYKEREAAGVYKNKPTPKPSEPYMPLGGRDERSGRSYSEQVEQIVELKKQSDTQDLDSHITREDLRKWFSKTDPEGGWKRINSKGEAIGPCAREPGEPKPKCMSNEKRAKLSKKERAAAVAAKRKHDPVADRAGKGGKPVNVSNFGKGKLGEAATWAQQAAIAIAMKKAGKKPKNEGEMDEACWDTHKQVGMKKKGGKMVPDCVPKNEEVELLDEKNKPTNPKLWARAKALAKSKFDVYPSAYANGWASKWYKSKGGGWRATSEETVIEAKKFGYDAINARFKKQTGSSLEDRAKHYAATSERLKKMQADYEAGKMKKEESVNEGIYGIEDSPLSATNSVKAMESKMAKEKSKSARMIKAIYKKKGLKKETIYDWEKSEKGGEKGPNAKIILKGGKTMTGKDRDTIEIDPVVRTKLNGANGTKPNV